MPPDATSETDRRLTEIRDDLREVKRLLIGSDGDDGALARIARVESRQSFITTCYLWVLFIVFGLAAMVVPDHFRQPK